MDCYDLRPWADARRYRWRFEEGGDETAWSAEVVCRRGKLYPFGGDDLLAWTDTRGVRAELLGLDPAVTPHQTGDREAVVRFPSRLLDRVAAVLRPRRRRTLDPERALAISGLPGIRHAQVGEPAEISTLRPAGA